jgi:hypothetical protein
MKVKSGADLKRPLRAGLATNFMRLRVYAAGVPDYGRNTDDHLAGRGSAMNTAKDRLFIDSIAA